MGQKDIDGAEGGDRQFVTALARGMELLGCYRDGDRFLSNQELARRTGLARPTVSRLTHTLTRTGHLVRDDTSGEYRLGGRVLQLGFRMLAATDVRERFTSEVESLTSGPNLYVTAALAERAGTRAAYIAASRARQAVALTIEVGAQLPLFYSGIGRALLVGLTDVERQAVLDQASLEFPGHRARMEDGIAVAISDFARYGYCTSFGAWKPEITSIATPFRGVDGRSVYAINVGAPTFVTSGDELHRHYGGRLLALSELLGGNQTYSSVRTSDGSRSG